MSEMPRLCFTPEEPSESDWKFADLKPRLSIPQGLLSNLSGLSDGDLTDFYLDERTPISNQLNLGSCVANGTGDAIEMLMPGTVIQVSRLMIYWLARNYHSATLQDNGTFIRYAFDSLSRFGVCPEELWPYETKHVYLQPPNKCMVVADSNKINGYYRIDSTEQDRLDDIEAALRSGHPVVFGTQVGNDWMAATNDSGAFGIPKSFLGGHCMVWSGVRRVEGRRQFWTRNSWGTGWGKNGHGWMDEDYVMWHQTTDIWVPTNIPALVA